MRKIEWSKIETIEYTDYIVEYIIENTPEQAEGLSDIMDEYIIDNKLYLRRLYEDAFQNDGFIPYFENRDKVRTWFNLYETEIDELLSGEYGDNVELMPVDSDGVLYSIVTSVWQYVAGIFYDMIVEALDLEPIAIIDDGIAVYGVKHGFDDEVIAGHIGEAPETCAIEYNKYDDVNAYFTLDGVEYSISDFIHVNYPRKLSGIVR